MSEAEELRIWHELCELMEPAEPEDTGSVSGEGEEEDEEIVFGGLALATL